MEETQNSNPQVVCKQCHTVSRTHAINTTLELPLTRSKAKGASLVRSVTDALELFHAEEDLKE